MFDILKYASDPQFWERKVLAGVVDAVDPAEVPALVAGNARLAQLLADRRPDHLATVAAWKGVILQRLQPYTADDLLRLLAEDRPEHRAALAATPEALAWWRAQVDDIKHVIANI